MSMNFRYLTDAEVEARVSTVTPNGCSALLYKDARCDMRILDETVGAENWQREHYECKGNLFCRVGININFDKLDQPERWVWKSDCGTESRTEAEKGEASDSFKRACFNWGIGRELYTAPFIWIPQTGKDGKENYKLNSKGQPDVRLKVTYMRVEDGKIAALNVENMKTRRAVYVFGDCFPEYSSPALLPSSEAPKLSEPISMVCSSCGKEIKDGKKLSGAVWPAADISKHSSLKYGRTLCWDCMAKVAKASEKKA